MSFSNTREAGPALDWGKIIPIDTGQTKFRGEGKKFFNYPSIKYLSTSQPAEIYVPAAPQAAILLIPQVNTTRHFHG